MSERNLPGLGLRAGWPEGTDHWGDEMDDNLRRLSALVMCRVLSMTTPLPNDDSNSAGVSPGDIYIMPVSDSNSFQDSNSNPHHGDIAISDEDGWHFITPSVGWIVYVVDLNAHYKYAGSGVWTAFGGTASAISYDSGTSGDSNSTVTDVASALDDLYLRIRNVSAGVVDATTVTYDAGDTGDSNSTMTNVATALDDLYSRIRAIGGTPDAYAVTYSHDVDSNSTQTTVGDALDELFQRPHDIGFRLSGTELSKIINYIVVRDWFIPIDFSGSQAYAGTPNATSITIDIYKNATIIGHVTFPADDSNSAGDPQVGAFSAEDSNSNTEISFTAGDRLGLGVPASVGTLADISITIFGTRIN